MFVEHIFEVRHLENSGDKVSVNSQEHNYSRGKRKLTALPRVHAIASMKSMNFRIEDYIPDIYKKAKYQEAYN